ncbi:PREDICTED: uncharacterized protein LOC104814881 [Tarenaya hassleriana]|uniref:uncharacterized protein LOC104814881 n=1 Tax=Tarenaya hassleriana TaxID=28532 RepID=UPI00053C9811|nr:PREDICTED: uncharacterized protein LOC104814881 [Tarenaya hassleriana]
MSFILMEAASMLLCSKVIPRGFWDGENRKVSVRHFDKQVKCRSFRADYRTSQLLSGPEAVTSSPRRICALVSARKGSWVPPKCSMSDATTSDSDNPLLRPFKSLSFDSLVENISQLKPIDVLKLSAVVSVLAVAAKKTVTLVFNPFLWMYFSWTWLFWPWFVAVSLAVYGLYCFRKHWLGEANVFEQLAIITSGKSQSFTWLTLVPPAHFNGYLEGWPFVFFLAYHYFLFYNISVRKRLYGDHFARPHDPKWDVNTPLWTRLLFCVGVMAGHWLGAFERPELHLLPGSWTNVGIWILIVIAMLTQYDSSLYLANYSEKVVVPTAVVQFGPYRCVRHPIYASTMLLFATYCIALRAPFSLLFIVAVCLVYYDKKAKLEEALMVEAFGQSYLDYANKVRCKFIPFMY